VTQLVQMAPGATVSLGILGTFVGVYVGLLGFDVQNISASIPQLLNGLKTAFMTSIWGIGVSIALRLLYSRLDDVSEDRVVQSDDPVVLLQGVLNGIEQLSAQTERLTQAITKGFQALDVSAQKRSDTLRDEMSLTREATVKAYAEFSDRMAEMGIDALVKALQQVIGDFNVLLGELVGSAFEELSSAMAKLVQWQDTYRQDMESMRARVDTLLSQTSQSTDLLGRSAEALAAMDARLSSATGSIEQLSLHAADLEAHIEAMKAQNAQLEAGLEHIKALGEATRDVVPSLDEHVRQMTGSLVSAASESTAQLTEANASIAEFVSTTTRELQAATESLQRVMQDAVEELDKGLEAELNKALNSLAGSLAALSERFVQDYQPLTERLREVVRLAEAVHDRQA